MLKKTLIATASILAATFGANASAEISLSGGVDLVSSYNFRGFELNEGSIQPYVEFSTGGAYFGVWHSKSLDEDVIRATDETDFYLGYGFDLSDKVSADIGVTRYTYITDDADTTEVYGGLSFDNAIAPSVYAYYDFDLETLTLEGSIGPSFGPVDLGATIGHIEPDAGDDFQYLLFSVAYNVPVTEKAGAYISANYGISSDDSYDVDALGNFTDDNGFWVSAGFSVAY